jgi:L-histidine Nalpha-methyltransferase
MSDVMNAAIVAGLNADPATISPKYFYDAVGCALFERITELPEYYLTRTERAIMAQHGQEMAEQITSQTGPSPLGCVIELGAGNCEKARELCALLQPQCFVAVDIAGDFLRESVAGLRGSLPTLDVRAVVADLNEEIILPADLPAGPRLLFYPGSSIGNFDPASALALLAHMRQLLLGGASDGALLIGVDLRKDTALLEAAYDDAAGVTAAFNLNALTHLNRLIGSNFKPGDWRHRAVFNNPQSRIEMHLEAVRDVQVEWHVHWQGRGHGQEHAHDKANRHFRRGERIHTESSYKYSVASFSQLLSRGGFQHPVCWTDPQQWFAVFLAHV